MNVIEPLHADEPGENGNAADDHALTIRSLLTGLVLVLLLIAPATAIILGASAADHNDSAQAAAPATISLAALPKMTADIYQYAAVHARHFVEIPCYCGCDKSLSHRNLEDCFVNPAGWDPHAYGCGICIAEAVAAREQLDAGVGISEVRQSIIARFGPTPAA